MGMLEYPVHFSQGASFEIETETTEEANGQTISKKYPYVHEVSKNTRAGKKSHRRKETRAIENGVLGEKNRA